MTHTSIYGIGHHVGSRKSTDATDVCLLTCFLLDICKIYMRSVISVISSCPWVVPQEPHNYRRHICHGPSSCHGRVNSENSCAPWSCSRCCGQRFHSRRFLDFLLFCHVLSICTLQDIIFNHVHNSIGSQTSMFLRCLQGEIIERVWATLPDVPCHGHTLLSSGLKKFNHSDVVPDGDHLAFANYSLLAGSGRLQIPTERSGITIPQIQALLDFVYGMIGVSKPGLWAGSFGEEHGRPLSFDTFNLYHADEWIIRPATAAVPGSSHGTGCSYVELLGNKFSYFS